MVAHNLLHKLLKTTVCNALQYMRLTVATSENLYGDADWHHLFDAQISRDALQTSLPVAAAAAAAVIALFMLASEVDVVSDVQ
jgi:hypothetical protein